MTCVLLLPFTLLLISCVLFPISIVCEVLVPTTNVECNHFTEVISTGNNLSFNIPQKSLPHVFCNYVINVTGKTQISMRFTDAWLEPAEKVTADYFVIFDGPDCMAQRNSVLFKEDNTIHLNKQSVLTALFISTSERANQRLTSKSNQGNCGSEVKGRGGIISHTGDSDGNLLCIWRITVEHGNRVWLRVTSLLFLHPESWLRVLDGNTCAAEEIFYITSKDKEYRTFEFLSTTNVLMFLSGSSTTQPDDLFKASYTSVFISTNNAECSQMITGTKNGTIFSSEFPQEYRSNAFCNYAINVADKAQISLQFTEAELGGFENEFGDYILLFDGPDCMATRMAVVTNKGNATHITKGNAVTALFITDENTPHGRFQAEYFEDPTTRETNMSNTLLLQNCGAEITGNVGMIYHTRGSKGNTLCIWRIKVDTGNRVKLRLKSWSSAMSGSWIRILDGSNCDAREMLHLTSDSGEMPKQEYVSTSNTLMLIFASSLAEPDDLFEASYMSDGYKSTEYLPTSDTITSQPSQPSTQKDSSVLLKPAIIVGISLLVNVIRALPTGT